MSSGKKEELKANLLATQRGFADRYNVKLITLKTLAKNLEMSMYESLTKYASVVVGLSGVGKTDTVRAAAERMGVAIASQQASKQDEYKFKPEDHCITLILSQVNEGDLQGLAFPNREKMVTERLPFKALPTEEAVAQGVYPERGILFLDELNRATREVQNAAFQLLGEKKCGDSKIAEGWVIWAAVNPEQDEYMVNKMDTAMMNRMAVYVVQVDPNVWLEWANSVGLNSCVIDFIATCNDALYDIQSHNDGKVFSTPRTWERVAREMDVMIKRFLKKDKDGKYTVSYKKLARLIEDHHSMIAGSLGSHVLNQLLDFMDDYTDQLNADDLVAHYLDSNSTKATGKPWAKMQDKVQTAAKRNAIAMLNNTNEQLLSLIRDRHPDIFKKNVKGDKKIVEKDLTPEFMNIHAYWADVTLSATDKSVQFFQGLLESHDSEEKKAKEVHAKWCRQLQTALNIMAAKAKSEGRTHFSTRILNAGSMGMSQSSQYAKVGSN